jgi:hypothetical protein
LYKVAIKVGEIDCWIIDHAEKSRGSVIAANRVFLAVRLVHRRVEDELRNRIRLIGEFCVDLMDKTLYMVTFVVG